MNVTGSVSNAFSLVCCNIVYKLVDGGGSGFGCFVLVGTNATEYNEDFIVNQLAAV